MRGAYIWPGLTLQHNNKFLFKMKYLLELGGMHVHVYVRREYAPRTLSIC